MMDAYSSIGMPINYHHWSFGKRFIETERGYKHGQMGLAYEIVINSDPCISYLMEENTITMQALVMAHACYGHNSFFKGNYLFQTWTDASSIIDYLLFARRSTLPTVKRKYGVEDVEQFARLLSCTDEFWRRSLQASTEKISIALKKPHAKKHAKITCKHR